MWKEIEGTLNGGSCDMCRQWIFLCPLVLSMFSMEMMRCCGNGKDVGVKGSP